MYSPPPNYHHIKSNVTALYVRHPKIYGINKPDSLEQMAGKTFLIAIAQTEA